MSTTEANGVITQPLATTRVQRVVEDHGPVAHLMDTARFEHLQRIAKLLASASLTPAHLIGKTPDATLGNCFQVTNQALRWGLDPFAVAAETYVVGNKLGYQGKLVAALVNTRANLDGKLRYEFDGAGDKRRVTVIGRVKGETEERSIDLSVGQAKTANKMWTSDPDQKLVYSGVTKWARRHCPEVMLGILTDDDLERMVESGAIHDTTSATLPPGRKSGRSSLNDTLRISVAEPGSSDYDRGVETEEVDDAEIVDEQPTGMTSKEVDDLLMQLNAHVDACDSAAGVEKSRQWAIERAKGDAGALEAIGTMCDMRLKELAPAAKQKPKQGSLMDTHENTGA